ncbi:DUF5994 family protein [Streptomyces achromogenes]|uniref:DUF5994 family protein n=1 Tax=Streptomyces achromogenes TaxID=67255 RepID=UPI0036A63CA4
MDRNESPAGHPPPAGAHTYRMPLPRLTLAPDGGHGPLHGAWWPRCDALELELPALAGALAAGLGTVVHVTVDTAAWPDVPHRVPAPGHLIRVSLSAVDTEAHTITLDTGAGEHRELLVVPPGEPADAARWLLTTAADPWNALSAPHMLALADATWER